MKRLFLLFFIFQLALTSCNTTAELEKNYSALQNQSNRIQKKYEKRSLTNPNNFSFVLIPDTQSYVDFRLQKHSIINYPVNQKDIYYNQMKFIAENSVQNNGEFSFAIHLGDFVDHRTWVASEWTTAEKGFDILHNQIPFLIVIGNHDYDSWKGQHLSYGTYSFNESFGAKSKYFKKQSWYGGSNGTGSSWAIFEAGNTQFLILALELEPSDKALSWAQEIIDSHKGMPTIYATHSYLCQGAEHGTLSESEFTDNYNRRKYPSNTSEQVWEKFISKNDQIFLVVCGHASEEGFRKDINDFGHTTYAILSDYQDRNEYLAFRNLSAKEIHGCGDGWLRFMNFDLDKKQIHVQTYSTEFECYEVDGDSDFYLPIDWEWNERFSYERNK